MPSMSMGVAVSGDIFDQGYAEGRREALQDVVKSLTDYAVAVHGEKPYMPLGTKLLEVNGSIPISWQFVAYMEQLFKELPR